MLRFRLLLARMRWARQTTRFVFEGAIIAMLLTTSINAGDAEDLMKATARDVPDEQRVAQILKKGVDLNAVMPDGNTLAIHLFFNMLKPGPEAVRVRRMLINHGLDPNARIRKGSMNGTSLLMLADAENAALLIAKGADPTLRAGDGSTALDFAIMQKDKAKIALLEKLTPKKSK